MKIIYIDNNDSFANIIASYFINEGVDVIMYKSSCSLDVIEKENPDMILLGPGPNDPKNAGNYLDVIDKYHKKIPIFGICLGFQAIMEYFGTKVEPLDDIIHGSSSSIKHDEKTIFKDIKNPEKLARYNSLGVKSIPESFELSAETENGIIMGARHKRLPIEGVQFHPESILSMHNYAGNKMIKNIVEVYKNG